MEQLQNLLSQEPSAEIWQQLIECLDNWSDESSLATALDYAEQELEEWSYKLRTPPSSQWKGIQNGESIPSWWRLVRYLEIKEDDHIQEPLPIEALEPITEISLNDCNLLPEDLDVLARGNKLGTLEWYDLIDSLDEWSEEQPISEMLDYAEQQLADWSDEYRKAPKRDWKAIREGGAIPRWWSLVRHLELGEEDGEISPIEAFTNLTSLDLSQSSLMSIDPLEELIGLQSLSFIDNLIAFSIETITNLKFQKPLNPARFLPPSC